MPLFRRSLKSQLRRLDRKIQLATDRFVASHLIRAAQLCVRAGEVDAALRYYGRAVDAYLSIGHGREAEVVCRRIIAVKPEVVRARRTLALILLGRSEVEAAMREIEAYVAAARAAGETELAVRQLRMMAAVTESESLVEFLFDRCRSLGARLEGPSHRKAVLPPEALGEAAGVWRNAVRLALTTPDEINMLWRVAKN